MITVSANKKSPVAKSVSKIISSICTLKFEYDCELNSQQMKDLDNCLVLLKNVLEKSK